MRKKRADDFRNEVFRCCKNLYRNYGCWECDDGWNDPLANLSYSLEILNLTIGKQYGYRIIADQVKEKYGTLRFYYSVEKIRPWWTQIFSAPLRWLAATIRRRGDFKMEFKDGKFLPTRSKILYKAVPALFRIANFLDVSFLIPQTGNSLVAMRFMDDAACRLIEVAEDECYKRCEICGDLIGNSWTARCETIGWIRYVCEPCAKKHKLDYRKIDGGKSTDVQDEVEDKMENMK